MRPWSFDVEITRLAPEPVVERTAGVDVHEAEAMVRAAADKACLVMAAQRDGEAYGDDFYIWLAAGRAIVRRDAHREWYAADPTSAASADDAEVEFRDEDGSSFTYPAAGTVSYAQAMDAFVYWLRTGELAPYLTWGSSVSEISAEDDTHGG